LPISVKAAQRGFDQAAAKRGISLGIRRQLADHQLGALPIGSGGAAEPVYQKAVQSAQNGVVPEAFSRFKVEHTP
jgi:hypothetical protein